MIGAVLSLGAMPQRWREMVPLWIAILFLTALHAATHASMRYRLPLDPLLMVLAAGPLAMLMNSALSLLGGGAPRPD
jgi:hypothetical protein